MKILFLSFYFEPDLCAGSFRNTALLKSLDQQLPLDCDIDVFTTVPSRYSSFSVEAPKHEVQGRVQVHRVVLPSHQSDMVDQSRAYLSYARAVLKQVSSKDYDFIYASSSRLMTASLGTYLSRKLKVPLYLDIRDIFVDTIKDVLPRKLVWALKPLFATVERWTFNRADKINLVSGGFEDYFRERYPTIALSFFPNGIDDEFLNLDHAKFSGEKELPEVLYAGNIGEGQGLHNIIPRLAKHFEGQLSFKIIGDGGRKAQLAEAISRKGLANVYLLPPIGRSELISAYQRADVLFMHLNNYDAFLKVLPSKVFEYGALGKPIWAGVSGFAAQFIEQNIDNAAVFDPCNAEHASSVFEQLVLQPQPRPEFVAQYSRGNIMQEMAADILDTAGVAK